VTNPGQSFGIGAMRALRVSQRAAHSSWSRSPVAGFAPPEARWPRVALLGLAGSSPPPPQVHSGRAQLARRSPMRQLSAISRIKSNLIQSDRDKWRPDGRYLAGTGRRHSDKRCWPEPSKVVAALARNRSHLVRKLSWTAFHPLTCLPAGGQLRSGRLAAPSAAIVQRCPAGRANRPGPPV